MTLAMLILGGLRTVSGAVYGCTLLAMGAVIVLGTTLRPKASLRGWNSTRSCGGAPPCRDERQAIGRSEHGDRFRGRCCGPQGKAAGNSSGTSREGRPLHQCAHGGSQRRFRIKTTPFKLSYDGDALNAILYCVQHSDGQPNGIPVFAGPISNDANGYPNIMALPDPTTVRHHGWDPRYASVILNSYILDGSRCALDPRAFLKDQEDRARKLGYEPSFALEYEFGFFSPITN